MPGASGLTLCRLSTQSFFRVQPSMIWLPRVISMKRRAEYSGSGQSPCGSIAIRPSPSPRLRRVRVTWLRRETGSGRTSAIFVYPMNALANSQINEIEKFIAQSGLPTELKPVVRRYTGQESQEVGSELQ